MSQSEKIQTRIHSIDERLARLRSHRERLLARASQAERKRDTRRKILIGAAVLAAIERGGMPSMRSMIELRRWLDERLARPHDRGVFGLEVADSVKEHGMWPLEGLGQDRARCSLLRGNQGVTAVPNLHAPPAPRDWCP